MEQTVQQFLDQLSESGLLSDDDLAALRESLPDTPETLAEITDTLVEQRKLTKFQADQISKGNGASLVLGNYLLVGEIGAGGMGKVYLAEHRRMKRRVALKTLPSAMIEDQQAVERFQREVQAAARLTHPNIVTAYDADEANGTHFFVMEYVEGADLRKLVAARGTLSVAQSVECVKQVAGGLDYAHRKGIVHRDIKPGNLLLDPEGTVKILDMGLARYQTSGEGDEGLTISGMAMGTADFMAPEQGVNAKNADARSDIYSLGCTLYFLLTGSKVYEGESIIEKIMAHQQQPIPDLSAVRPDVPSELAGIFKKMVAKRPEERFQSAGEVVESLTQLSDLDVSSDSGLKSNSPLRALAGSAFGPTELSPSPLNQSVTRTFVSSVYDDTVEQAPEAEPATTHPPKRRWGLIAGGLLGLVVLIAGLIIKLQTPAGYVVLEIDQPEIVGAQVLIDGEKSITIRTGNGEEQIRVTPDKERHKLEVQMAGFKTFTEEFSYDTGSKRKIKVTLVPLDAVADVDEEEVQPVVASSSGENWALELDGKTSRVTFEPMSFDIDDRFTLDLRIRSLSKKASNVLAFGPCGAAVNLGANGIASGAFRSENAWTELISGPLPDSQVALFSVVYADQKTALYINGKKQDEKSFPGKIVVNRQSSQIGGWGPPVPPTHIFHGIIDEVRISNVARYTEDFTPAKRFENDEHTIALYHFDEGQGDVLKDSSGNGHHGKIVGAKWVRVDNELKVLGYVWPKDQPDPAISPFTPEEAKRHQEAWAKHLGVPVETTNSIGMKFRVIPPGEFLMGSSEEEIEKLLEEAKAEKLEDSYIQRIPNEGPRHPVTLTKPFGLAIHEVTRGQFRQFVEATGYTTDAEKDGKGGYGYKVGRRVQAPEFLWNTKLGFKTEQTDDHPVVNVSWNDAVAFCEWLSKKEGVTYRLPTEAEWEFACRAGNPGRFSFGDDEKLLGVYAWWANQGGRNTKPVGQKASNSLGLFDLHGNVWEWCRDGYGRYNAAHAIDPVGTIDSTRRLLRGGAFFNPPGVVRSANRTIAFLRSDLRNNDCGFRPARIYNLSP